MRANQKLKQGNTEVCLFPLEYMYLTQGELNAGGSHAGILAMDFQGYGANGRIYKCPLYAPVSAKVVVHQTDYVVWESLENVLLADGTISKICWQVGHDDTPPALGTIVQQGDLMGHTGTTGQVTGDHTHLNFARGNYQGFERVSTGNSQLKNSIHLYNTCYINDTIIVVDGGYNWITYVSPVINKYRKSNFKFYLFKRNLTK